MSRIEGTKKYWEKKGTLDLRKNKALSPVESGMPISAITMDLTKRCNLACKYCNVAGTPILMKDLTYKRIEELVKGDEVIGFVTPKELGKHTHYSLSVIEGTAEREAEVVDVVTTNGTFRCTPDHKWFNGRHYVPAKVGMSIHYVSDPVYFEETDEYRKGYIHGIMEGDANFAEGKHIYKSGSQEGTTNVYHHFRLALNDQEPLDRIEEYLSILEWPSMNTFEYTEKMNGLRSGRKDLFQLCQGLISEDSTLEYIRGWIAGIFDAEGSYDKYSLRISQMPGNVLESIKLGLSKLGFEYKEEPKKDHELISIRLEGGTPSTIKFFATCKPAITRKKDKVLINKSIYGKSEVLEIKPVGLEKVYSLQTSTGNYIAHGHTSKNCFTNLAKGAYKADDISEEMAFKIVRWVLRDDVSGPKGSSVDITFWGGEPLLRWELLQKVVLYAEAEAEKAGKRITFGGTTNVTLLTEDKFDFLDEHNVRFLLSIDGKKETHDRNRVFSDGTGSWTMVDSRIDAILKRWPNYSARLSFSTDNVHNFLEDIQYLHSRGFKHIAFSPVCEGDWTPEHVENMRKEWIKIADWWVEKWRAGDQVYVKYIQDFLSETLMPRENTIPCGAGRGYIGITTDGSIHPCHRFNKFNDPRPWWEQETTIGHIDYGIINQDFRKVFVEWDAKRDMHPSCAECPAHIKHCSGGCWASNWDIAGDLAAPITATCESVLANMEVAKYLLALEPKLKDYYGPRQNRNQQQRRTDSGMPPVQGCQCYNVDDSIYGRITINKNDPNSCVCNMATYGVPPRQVEKCVCYNAEDAVVSHYDQSGMQCGRFDEAQILREKVKMLNTVRDNEEHECGGSCGGEEEHSCCGGCGGSDGNPLVDAIKYLQDMDHNNLNQEEKKKIAEFAKLLNKTE